MDQLEFEIVNEVVLIFLAFSGCHDAEAKENHGH